MENLIISEKLDIPCPLCGGGLGCTDPKCIEEKVDKKYKQVKDQWENGFMPAVEGKDFILFKRPNRVVLELVEASDYIRELGLNVLVHVVN